MQSHAVSGTVQLADSVAATSFSLSIPVDSFVIDDAAARREAGSDFSSEVTDDAKSGTRKNMLSPALLNGAEFPNISVKAGRISGTPTAPLAELTITGGRS